MQLGIHLPHIGFMQVGINLFGAIGMLAVGALAVSHQRQSKGTACRAVCYVCALAGGCPG